MLSKYGNFQPLSAELEISGADSDVVALATCAV